MTTTARNLEAVDLRNCDKEPIRIPGSIQPHGVLLALDPANFRILQVSASIQELLGISTDSALSGGLKAVLGEDAGAELISDLQRVRLVNNPIYLRTFVHNNQPFHTIAHLYAGMVILELEHTDQPQTTFLRELYPLVSDFVSRLTGLKDGKEVAAVAAEQIREITKFDRILVYKFDHDWNGTVIAESRNHELPSYMDLRFPASDIPAQARDLYRLNPTRLISDVSYVPSPLVPDLNPKTGKPLDMSFAALRSVSPIHREYMRNMGTAASMSISLIRDGELWGLISCHNKLPRKVAFDVRKACEFIGQVVSVQTESHEQNAIFSERVRLKTVHGDLLAHMAQRENFADGLVSAESSLLAFAEAEGAAVMHGETCALVGTTPHEDDVRKIVEWLSVRASREDVFHTNHLSSLMPEAKAFVSQASGLLAVRISKLHNSYVLWFRPEVIQTVRWSGDPTKPVDPVNLQLHPRKSFELWKETVRDQSLPFSRAEIEAALELRNAVVGIVLRKAEEMAELTAQLRRSNKELEAFSYSVSHDLRAPFRHIVGYAELLRERESRNISEEGMRYVNTIIDSAQFAGLLVDNLLNLSRIARASLSMMRISMNDMVREVQREFAGETKGRRIEWYIGDLPDAIVDPILMRLALRNLLSNAIKYSKTRELAILHVDATTDDHEMTLSVRDNGVGFDMRYVDKLFGVFQRLHRMEEFDGTGIGLANVRRIIERHGGRTWAEGEPGKGATFYFSLPTTSIVENERAEANLVS